MARTTPNRAQRDKLLAEVKAELIKSYAMFDDLKDKGVAGVRHQLHKKISRLRDRMRYLSGSPESAAELFASIGRPVHPATLARWQARGMRKGFWDPDKKHHRPEGRRDKTQPLPPEPDPPSRDLPGEEEARAQGERVRAERAAREAQWQEYYRRIEARRRNQRRFTSPTGGVYDD